MTEHPPTPGYEDRTAADLIDCARQAEDAVRRLAHLTHQPAALTPADVDTVLSHLAETIAALPQLAGQFAAVLDRTRDTHLLAMDGMTATTDPDMAIDTARHHLNQARHPAVETYRHLNAARNEVAHISVTDDLVDESWSGHPAVSDRRPQPKHGGPPPLGVVRDSQHTPGR